MKNLVALAALSSRPLSLALSLAAALTLSVGACGGTVVFEEDGDGSDGSGGDSSVDTSSNGPTGAGGDGAVGTSIVASQAAAGTSSQGVGGGGELTIVRVEPKISANCKPEVGPDPMSGSVLVEYENLSSEVASATLTRADVIFSNEVEGWIFPIRLSPVGSGDVGVGDRVSVEHQKVDTEGDSSFVCQLCGLPGSVTLHFETGDGVELEASGPFDLACAL